MPYIFYSLFTPAEAAKPEITTQYFENIEDQAKHNKAVAIIRDLEDMIHAAKRCTGKGKKCYLTEAVDDMVFAMSSSETVWPNAIMEKYDLYIADARLLIAAAEDVTSSPDGSIRENDDKEDDDMMLSVATGCEDMDMRERLVARWRVDR